MNDMRNLPPKMRRMLEREQRFRAARANEASGGGKAPVRRREQMLKGSLTPANGVVKEYMCDNSGCQNTVTSPGICATCAMMAEVHSSPMVISDQ